MSTAAQHSTPGSFVASASASPSMPEIAVQSAKLLGHYAGYAATWTIRVGLEMGLFASIAQNGKISAERLAAERKLDVGYTVVWCRAAYAGGLLDLAPGGAYALAPHMATLLLDRDSAAYLGGMSRVFVAMRETLAEMPALMKSGRRAWWSDFGGEWIDAVGDAGQSFYSRMLELVFPKLPGVRSAFDGGGRVLDLACGTCNGPIKLARAYPSANFMAVDADAATLRRAAENLSREGLMSRFDLHQSMLEELALEDAADAAIINISLHEARDIARVVENAHRALRKGGTFVVSEFPFPESLEACRMLPAQILCGIQFFEAHIGCQLLPTSRFVTLLDEAGFRDAAAIQVSPVHVVVHGTK